MSVRTITTQPFSDQKTWYFWFTQESERIQTTALSGKFRSSHFQ